MEVKSSMELLVFLFKSGLPLEEISATSEKRADKYRKVKGLIQKYYVQDKSRARDVRKSPNIVDADPSNITLEGPEQLLDKWPKVNRPTPSSSRVVYPGAGSELFHGKKKK